MDIPFFSMFGGGLAHIMHEVLEGVAPLEMSLLLQHIILREKFLTLNYYNFQLMHFDYGYTETNRPIAILYNHLNKGKSASHTVGITGILPFLIGDVVPADDPKWTCFITLLRIVDIIMCPWSSTDLCGVLKVLITEHHQSFVSLYKEAAVIPKFHFSCIILIKYYELAQW